MDIFLTGATGWIGSAVARELLAAGHRVTGLARSDEGARALAAAGVTPLLGALADLPALRRGADAADGVIHTAFGLDFSDYRKLGEEDRAAIEAFGDVLAGSDRPLVVTSGLGLLPAGAPFTEAARPPVIPAYPRASEQTAFALAARGVRASVVRPARSVHGLGERHGFVPQLARLARDTGVSAWIDDGASPWPAVHRDDAARVYRLALERGAGGEAYHAVAQGVPFRLVAQAIARQTGVPARSLTATEAQAHFGPLAVWLTGAAPVATDFTRTTLGWTPREIDLITDIDRAAYHAT